MRGAGMIERGAIDVLRVRRELGRHGARLHPQSAGEQFVAEHTATE
jgi:hypothetical protein